jgi:hypothetical protein
MSASAPVIVSDGAGHEKEREKTDVLDETTVEYIPGPNIARRSGDVRITL